VWPSLIAAALRGVPDVWAELDDPVRQQQFVAAASAHRVRPLLAWTLGRSGELDRWPAAVRQSLVDAARAEAALEIARRDDLCRLVHAVASTGIDVLVVKGASLAYDVYAEPWLRPREDTDILVPPEDAPRAAAALGAVGYRAVPRPSGTLVAHQQLYVRSSPHPDAVDLHWKIADPAPFADLLSADELFRNAVDLHIDASCRARVPCRSHALLLACWHRVAHHHDAERLLWLYDMHLLAGTLDDAACRIVTDIAARTQTSGVCARALTLAGHYFQSPHVARLVDQLPRTPEDDESPVSRYLREDARKVDLLLADLRALPTWKARALLVGQHLFPPADYMRATYRRSRAVPLPALYVWRIVNGARRWFHRPQ
jgi:Uncharacterised nucleotidyltransferase